MMRRMGYEWTVQHSFYEQMNVGRCDHVIQDLQIIPLFCFIKPLEPTMMVFREFEQKLSFVTPVGKRPNLAREIMSFRSCHGWLPAIIPFLTMKTTI